MDKSTNADTNHASTMDDDAIQARLAAWFQVLHRLARIQENNPMEVAWTATPLDPTIAELAEARLVMVMNTGRPDGKVQLILRPEGWDLYDEFCRDMAAQGRPVLGWVAGRHRTQRTAPDSAS
jgi:hypothetical protein